MDSEVGVDVEADSAPARIRLPIRPSGCSFGKSRPARPGQASKTTRAIIMASSARVAARNVRSVHACLDVDAGFVMSPLNHAMQFAQLADMQ